ncbi:MAG: hypothetical protein QGD94_09645, partial [Planctomycetia bacterium]|nr:hypothetical protein [Planctomycetia bacterium]
WETEKFLQQEVKYREEMAKFAILTRLLMPGLAAVMELGMEADASMACARAGIAVRLYRDKEGEWPQSLKQVVPGYLKEIPLDPFDGEPLKYTIKQGHAIVYSVGSNKEDDGGIPPGDDWETGDITFEVRVAED